MNSANTILFVCLHGAAKSILAEADFRRLAAERGLELSADSAGTEPDPEIAPGVVQALLSEGVDVRDRKPRKITRRDVAGADRVVTFGCDLGEAVAPTARIEHWTDVPAVSDDLPAARAAIRRHLERLITEYVEKGVTP